MSQYSAILSNKNIGILSNLQTTMKSDLVSSINELYNKVGAGGGTGLAGNSYVLELSKWGITNSVTTTTADVTLSTNNSNGINSAIQWASQNNYTEVVFPLGTYLINEFIPIEPTSFMTLNLNGSTLRIRDNSELGYALVNYRWDQKFVRVTNGIIKGDRYNHDYYVWDINGTTSKTWTMWSPNVTYNVGDKVMPTDTNADNYGNYWQCTTAGISGPTEPVWNTGGTTTSGTAVFTSYARHSNEWGMGVLVPINSVDPTKGQGTNIRFLTVDNIEFLELTGDGVSFVSTGGASYTTTDHKNNGYPYNITFEQGEISKTDGSLIANSNKVRSNIYIDLTGKYIQKYQFFGIYGDIAWDSVSGDIDNTLPYDIFFYDINNKFISYKPNVEFWDEILLPTGATSCKIVLHQATIPANSNSLTVRCELIPKFCFVEKCHIHNTRRLGVALQGAKFIWVRNNEIHDIKGTGPDGCMDVEDNYAMNQNLWIEDNYFHDSKLLIIIVKGKNFQIRNNKFENGPIQTDVGARRIFIDGNYFKDSSITMYTEGNITNNHFTRSSVSILDGDPYSVLIDNNQFWNSLLSVSRLKSYSVIISNCRFFADSDCYTLNNFSCWFAAGTAPQTMTNCTFEGYNSSTTSMFSGNTNATEGWSYSNLLFINNAQAFSNNRGGISLPRGTYTNCRFNNPGSLTPSNRADFIGCAFTWDGYSLMSGGADLTRFINCTFKGGNSTCFYMNSVTTAIRIEVTDCFFEYPSATSTSVGIVDGFWSGCTNGTIVMRGNRFTSNLAIKAINSSTVTADAFRIIFQNNTLEGTVTYATDQTQLQNWSGNTIGGVVDPYSTVASVPTTGFYKYGKQLTNSNMATAGFYGWVCTKEGLLDTYGGWSANSSYNYQNRIMVNGYVYYCTNRLGGKSTSTAPTFPATVGASVYDSTAPVWTASTAYIINAMITPTSSDGSWFYQCTTAGTSGSIQPTWGAGTVTDGTVTWTKQTAVLWKNMGATGCTFKQFGTLS